MSAKKPRYVAHNKTFMAVEALTRHEKKSTSFMRIEKGTKATATKGTEVNEPAEPVESEDSVDTVEDNPKKKTSKKKK